MYNGYALCKNDIYESLRVFYMVLFAFCANVSVSLCCDSNERVVLLLVFGLLWRECWETSLDHNPSDKVFATRNLS